MEFLIFTYFLHIHQLCKSRISPTVSSLFRGSGFDVVLLRYVSVDHTSYTQLCPWVQNDKRSLLHNTPKEREFTECTDTFDVRSLSWIISHTLPYLRPDSCVIMWMGTRRCPWISSSTFALSVNDGRPNLGSSVRDTRPVWKFLFFYHAIVTTVIDDDDSHYRRLSFRHGFAG